MMKKCKEKAKMETIIIYHRYVLAALYPVKEWTTNRAKKAGEMAVWSKQQEDRQSHIHDYASSLFFLNSCATFITMHRP